MASRYDVVVTNPIHFLAVNILQRALATVVTSPGADIASRFRKALVGQVPPQDAPVLDAALRALDATGHDPETLDGPGGLDTLQAAVRDAIRRLQSTSDTREL